jgi:Holliday junction resolvase
MSRHEMTATEYQGTATEADFQRAVVDFLHLHGWKTIHFPNTKYNPLVPDLLCIRDSHVLFLELKTDRGVVTPTQAEMLTELRAYGATVWLVRPRDWEIVQTWMT